jgi:hypothetical protein
LLSVTNSDEVTILFPMNNFRFSFLVFHDSLQSQPVVTQALFCLQPLNPLPRQLRVAEVAPTSERHKIRLRKVAPAAQQAQVNQTSNTLEVDAITGTAPTGAGTESTPRRHIHS